MIRWNKSFLRIGEVFFDEIPRFAEVDVIRYNQRSIPPANCRFQDFFSIVVDLSLPEEKLMSAVDRETRYDIRLATRRDSVTYRVWHAPDEETTLEFCTFYDKFAVSKRLRLSNRNRLLAAQKGGSLSLSSVLDRDGAVPIPSSVGSDSRPGRDWDRRLAAPGSVRLE